MILGDDDGSSASRRYWWHSYDGSSTQAMKLHIEYVAWENTAPTITTTPTTTGTVDTAYSQLLEATDPDTNQTLIWEINATNADFFSIESLNRSAYLNGTATTEGSWYVNVTTGDEGATGNLTDYVNWTVTFTELVSEGSIFDSLLPVGLAVSGFMLFFGLYAHTRPGGKTMGQLLVFIGGIALIYTGFDYQLSIQDAEMALMIIVAGIGIVALSAIELAQSKR